MFRVSIGPGEGKSSESVSGFGFQVSGFGFRRLKPTFAVGFGFRVSGFGRSWGRYISLQSRFRVSGFMFRVSIGPGEGKSSESVSGFGFRVSIGPGEESVSGFGFRLSGFDWSWGR